MAINLTDGALAGDKQAGGRSHDRALPALKSRPLIDVRAVAASTTCHRVRTHQVPAKPVYLTDAASRKVNAGTRTIVFKRASPSNLVGAGTVTGDVYQALRHLGPDGVDDVVVSTLRRRLSDMDKRQLARSARQFRAWMRPVIDRVTSGRR